MKILHMATLYTDVLEMRSPLGPTEGGQMTLEVEVNEMSMKHSGDPQRYFFRELALHLAQGIVDTGIERQYWYVVFTHEARTRFNLPESARMGG